MINNDTILEATRILKARHEERKKENRILTGLIFRTDDDGNIVQFADPSNMSDDEIDEYDFYVNWDLKMSVIE